MSRLISWLSFPLIWFSKQISSPFFLFFCLIYISKWGSQKRFKPWKLKRIKNDKNKHTERDIYIRIYNKKNINESNYFGPVGAILFVCLEFGLNLLPLICSPPFDYISFGLFVCLFFLLFQYSDDYNYYWQIFFFVDLSCSGFQLMCHVVYTI